MSQTEKTRITVEIYGNQYIIVGSESASHIRHVALMVDEKMREIHSKNPALDTTKLAVLTAINAVNDYVKIKERLEELEKEVHK
ncbi:cell division protein ZapA [Bacillus benzoevorans]|uniref:Cell division protein ZapA n=1 Tax=Bacillus benzoevorans TaxID=1456 RepID=A0A7X0HU80_9BACI|nr:cell division protein ZapA [Bacillus benzoevorans]MBB6445656.1 cell division protein ZapA [Bacillus benzoevorans]